MVVVVVVVVVVVAVTLTACTKVVYVKAPAVTSTTLTASTTTTLVQVVPTQAPVTTQVPSPVVTNPPCAGTVTTVYGGRDTASFDNVQQQDGSYIVVFQSLVYNNRTDPIVNILITFSYETAGGVGGSCTGFHGSVPIGAGGSTAWTTDVPEATPATSITVIGITYQDTNTGVGCHNGPRS